LNTLQKRGIIAGETTNAMHLDIRFIPKEDLETTLPLLKILNPKTEDDVLIARVRELQQTNYQCAGVYHEGKLIAISGFWILHKISTGKHMEADNVVVHPDFRGSGVGEQLLSWLHQRGKELGCEAAELNCYATNNAGLRFWMNLGYQILGFHMYKKL